MAVLDQVTRLVQDALDDFDKPGSTVSSLLRRAIRVAKLRNDHLALFWLEMEAFGVEGSGEAAQRAVEMKARLTSDGYVALVVPLVEAFMARRSWPELDSAGMPKPIKQGGAVNPTPVSELEREVASLTAHMESLIAPAGLNPVDLYNKDNDIQKARMVLLVKIGLLNKIIEQVRSAIFTYLTTAEHQLLYGQTNADLFERNREFVDQRLGAIAPETLAQFTSVYRRLNEGDAEALSQALTSCRRVLKSLADQLYPARSTPVIGRDGKPHPVTEDKVVNRLVQFVTEASEGRTTDDLLNASIMSFGLRFDRLIDMSSKGVHSDVSPSEAEQCAIQTYLIVGDLLRLADGTSALLLEARSASDAGATGQAGT